MNIKDIDLNLLTLFETVYTTRSISRAATVLDMNQPTVSNALGRLRKQLGDPLFVRDGNGVAPTPRAEAIIGPVQRALSDLRMITDTVDSFDPGTSERDFCLYMLDVFEPLLLPPLAQIARRNRGFNIRLLPPQAVPCEEVLLNGTADLALNIKPERQPGIVWEELCPMDLVVIARRGHPEVQGTITAEQIATLDHVSLDLSPPLQARGASSNLKTFMLKRKFLQRYALRVARPSAIPAVVSWTDLLAFTPRFYAEALQDQLGLQILEPPEPLTDMSFFLAWNERNTDNPGLKWLRDQCRAILAPAGDGKAASAGTSQAPPGP